ncbi:MAG: hypothetical protein KAU62_14280 [Candidatus Heimdallarchaeota archaeon]|nr:hypothetical protein [Candidatus Heimdallarchaeota archaeon]MCK4612319.1 hypothetical protein [Candidatus Heimdallarchaeota archaeon]
MATLTLPFVTLIVTSLIVAVALAIFVVFTRTLRDTKSNVDSSYDMSK